MSKMSLLVLFAAAALVTGCATKNYVKATVAPVQTKVDQVSDQTNKNTTAIDQTNQNVAKNTTAISASAAGFVSPVAFSTMRTPAACSKSRPSALISTSTVRPPTMMRELLTPALWACAEPAYVVRQAATANKTSARDTFIAGSAERRDAHAHCKSGGAVLRTLAHTMTPADGSFTAPRDS